MGTRRRGDGGMEANTMAILDSSIFNKTSRHLSDDRIAFLEAVHSSSIVPENGSAPTNKIYEAIFQILKDETSLDLIMASYQLLNELDKRFPRVYFNKTEKSEPSESSTPLRELVVVKEAWSPWIFSLDFSSGEKQQSDKEVGGSLDVTDFHLLIEGLVKVLETANSEALESKRFRDMLLLQYLINVLEGDFLPRNSAYQENMNWVLMRESLLNMLLGSGRILYKALIKDCLFVMCEMSHCPTDNGSDTRDQENFSVKDSQKHDNSISIALPEVEKCTCIAIQKLLSMIVELDSLKKIADIQGITSRADGIRTPVADIILDELTYNRDILFPFFQVFNEPKLKLDMAVQYLYKYIPKSSVRTRKSNNSKDDSTFGGVLKLLTDRNGTKSIIKKIGTEVAQLLLAQAFQAYISLPSQWSTEGISDYKQEVGGGCLSEICRNLISAYSCLKKTDELSGILPFGKEALFTAATILSRSSRVPN